MRPFTRFRQRRKLEGFNSRRMTAMTSRSTKPVRFSISSKLVLSSQANRTIREICSGKSVGFM
jgi:hypothetical protein